MLFVFAIFLVVAVAKGSSNDGTGSRVLWNPSDGRSRDEWMNCNGLPAESCSRMPGKLKRLVEVTYGQTTKSSSALWNSNTVDGCILLTEEQLDYMIAEAEYERMIRTDHSRWKRQTLNFTTSPYSKWWLPIVYKFDGTHNSTEQTIIRSSVQLWESETCLRFREIPTDTSLDDNHILFTKPNTPTCNSYLGRVSYIPQPINLGEGCLSPWSLPGTPVHEIGHAIGLNHEHQRTDRDDYVEVLQENIDESKFVVSYAKRYTTRLVPYHFGSVMHYSDTGFAKNSSLRTMRAHDPLYQRNMGQNAEISFDDAHAANIAYNCDSQLCSGSPAITCHRGGYRDPNNCDRCRCPDGFGGTYCERVADPVNAICGGSIILKETDSVTIQSPGYSSPGYDSFQECSWLISGPTDREMTLQFVDTFGFICSTDQGCYWHWVEVKYKHGLDLEGARFCCRTRPDVSITSESSEMLVVFKTNFDWPYTERGFRAVVTVGKADASEQSCGRSIFTDAGEMYLPAPNIIGGMDARQHEFPWQTTLTIHTPTGTSFCGGSVLNDRWVLTAAHCVCNSNGVKIATSVEVGFGAHRRAVPLQRLSASSSNIYVHPDYTITTYVINNDICLLGINDTITLGQDVAPICLPSDSAIQFTDRKAVISGWGLLAYTNKTLSDILQYSTVNITSNTHCARYWTIGSGHVCTFDNINNTQRTTCMGDSGGPLTVKESNGTFYQVGVTSYGNACNGGKPPVFTRVSSYLPWIHGYIGNAPAGMSTTTAALVASTASTNNLLFSTILIIMVM